MLASVGSPPVLDSNDEEPALVVPDGDGERDLTDLHGLMNIEFEA
jgi:hypothetical protein